MQFQNIKKQRVLINRLTEIIDSGRISHAQLFLGETQSGALSLAIAYMQYLCCQHRQHYREISPGQWTDEHGHTTDLRADSCGVCPSCRKFEALEHPDLHIIFPSTTTNSVKSNPSAEDYQEDFRQFMQKHGQYGTLNQWYDALGVENKQGLIRERDAANIIKYINLRPYEAPYKMVLIWAAEKMNSTSANTLLKTLEEPTGNTLIILVCESTEKMLSTIISRVQQVNVPAIGETSTDGRETEFARWFVDWMRMLFKLNMSKLSAWVDQIAKIGREPQKQFLLYAMEALRGCFLRNITKGTYNQTLDFGDEKFNQSFYTVITQNNIPLMNEALNHTLMSIERNASPALAFMALSFKMSSYISKK
ncbi:MAG: hypothetical protein IJ764_00730 [Bacteroidales bacterium]|nr:hypothetical protein [Bacteroidales bacterium]